MRTVRISSGSTWCTGLPIAPDLTPREEVRTSWVLTCAHLFRHRTDTARILNHRVEEIQALPGTDIAVVRLDRQFAPRVLPRISPTPLPTGSLVTIHGRLPRAGRLLGTLPFSLSRQKTLLRPAGVVWASPHQGDSGGPVVRDGIIYATQSLILGYFATVNLLSPHWHSLREIMR